VKSTPEGNGLNRDIGKEKGDSAKNADAWTRGGGGVWMTPAYDPESGTIYVAVGNPSPDLDGSQRPGDNLYTDAVVAIDAASGKTKWYYQTCRTTCGTSTPCRRRWWRRSTTRRSSCTRARRAGLYILDAANGKLVKKSDAFVPQENIFALPTGGQGTRMLPGPTAAPKWSADSVDPTLGYAFVAALHQPMWYRTNSCAVEKGRLWLGSAFVAIPGEEQYGLLSAHRPEERQDRLARRRSRSR
jgi:glucose dehydrogenase